MKAPVAFAIIIALVALGYGMVVKSPVALYHEHNSNPSPVEVPAKHASLETKSRYYVATPTPAKTQDWVLVA